MGASGTCATKGDGRVALGPPIGPAVCTSETAGRDMPVLSQPKRLKPVLPPFSTFRWLNQIQRRDLLEIVPPYGRELQIARRRKKRGSPALSVSP
jgi:hypothetical protein